MKLLFDQNLSPVLIGRLSDLFPEASHVSLVGLDRASDIELWEHARLNDLCIVTKASDFNDVSVLRGSPPKVIWMRLGNCTTDEIERALRSAFQTIVEFQNDASSSVLEIQ